MARYLTVVPAYGRDYRSGKAALADWKAGKDFRIATVGPDDGRYMSVRDMTPDLRVIIRYNQLRGTVNAPNVKPGAGNP
jgi:hypothetical protein